ncbi:MULTISPECIES: GapR family DNA-binding domain-containing protein, partial [Streptomyces]
MRARGDNDKPETGGIAAERLRSIVERIERLEEERKALSNDIKDIY